MECPCYMADLMEIPRRKLRHLYTRESSYALTIWKLLFCTLQKWSVARKRRLSVPSDAMKPFGFCHFKNIGFIASPGAANGDQMLGNVLVLLAGGSLCRGWRSWFFSVDALSLPRVRGRK